MSRRTLIERIRQRGSQAAALAFLALVIFSQTPQQGSPAYELLILPAIVLTVTGLVGRLWCTTYIGGRKDNQLVTDGPYSLWRNPLYVFSFIGFCGILLATRLLMLAVIAAPLFFAYYYFVIRSEEARLRQFFGNDFEDYCRKVGVLVPAIANYHSRPAFEINPRYYHKAMGDSAMFAIVLAAIETIHRCKVLGWIKPLIVLPF